MTNNRFKYRNLSIILFILFFVTTFSWGKGETGTNRYDHRRDNFTSQDQVHKSQFVVNVYHYISPIDGVSMNKSQQCFAFREGASIHNDTSQAHVLHTHQHNDGIHFKCNWLSWYSNNFTYDYWSFHPKIGDTSLVTGESRTLRVGLYNLQSMYRNIKAMSNSPIRFKYVMIETLEAMRRRYKVLSIVNAQINNRKTNKLIPTGYSSTFPKSSVERIYDAAFMHEESMLPVLSHDKLIKGAVYIASNCEKIHPFYGTSKRERLVVMLRERGFRVDGLGSCLTSKQSDSPEISSRSDVLDVDLTTKRIAINKYMFYLAFENKIEKGYVTEKIFDGLLAGTVPIYLGDSKRSKSLLPNPDTAIFVSDYEDNVDGLVQYLDMLAANSSAYEKHREWRQSYNSSTYFATNKALSKHRSWNCDVCAWAIETSFKKKFDSKKYFSDNVEDARLEENHAMIEASMKVTKKREEEERAKKRLMRGMRAKTAAVGLKNENISKISKPGNQNALFANQRNRNLNISLESERFTLSRISQPGMKNKISSKKFKHQQFVSDFNDAQTLSAIPISIS